MRCTADLGRSASFNLAFLGAFLDYYPGGATEDLASET